MLPIIPNTYRCAFNWVSSSDPALSAVNVMHIRKSGSNPADIAADIDAHVNFAMWQHTTNACKIQSIDITPLDGSSTTFPFTPSSYVQYTGSGGTGDLVPQVAAIIKLLTAKRGRSYRGRLFLPWVSEAALNFGNIAASNVTGLTTAWIAFHLAMDAADAKLVVASYKLASAEEVVALIAESYSGTVRRRQKRLTSR